MRTITRVAIRLIIIAIAIQTLSTTITESLTLFRYHSTQTFFSLSLIIGIAVIIYIILSFLWWKTEWLVNVLAGRVSNHELIISTSNIELFRIVMRILGAYLLVTGVPSLLGAIGYYIALPDVDSFGNPFGNKSADLVRSIIVPGVKILIGIWLVSGTKNIFKILDTLDDKVHMREPEEKPE